MRLSRKLILAVMGLLAAVATHAADDQEVTALVYLPDGQTLISGNLDGALHLWDPETGKERRQVMAHPGGVFAVVLSPDGQRAASSGADGKIRLWDAIKVEPIRSFDGHEKGVFSLAFSTDGKRLASGSADKTIRVWSVEDGKELRRIPHPGDGALSLAFVAEGKILASGGCETLPPGPISPLTQSQPVHLWDLATGKLLRKLPHQSKSVAVTPDGRYLLASGDYYNITREGNRVIYATAYSMHLWDLVRNREAVRWADSQYALAISADGRWLASGLGTMLHTGTITSSDDGSRGIQFRDLNTGTVVCRIRAVREDAAVIALSPDHRRLAAGRLDGSIRIHNLAPKDWQAKPLTAEEREHAWDCLAQDSGKAYEAIWALVGDPESAITLVESKLKPATPIQPGISQLLANLDSPEFAVRAAADKNLRDLQVEGEFEMLRLLRDNPPLEVRTRVEAILGDIPRGLPAHYLRQSRALEVLERINSPMARKVVESYRGGASGAWLTRQAAAALDRLDRRRIKQ